MSPLALPLELLLEVAGYLELHAYVALSSCNRALHQILQDASLAWLVTNLPKKKRDRPVATAPILKSANAMVLGHALQYIVQVHGTSRVMTQELVAAGASFAAVGCGDFVEQEFRANGASFKIKFAMLHGASMRSVPCGLEVLLEETVWKHFGEPRTTWLLQHISLDQIPGGLDHYMARLVKRSGATQRTEFLISQGAEPPDKAEYMDCAYRKRGVGEFLFNLFARGGYPLREDRMGELLLWAVEDHSHQTSVQTMLDQGASWPMTPGGINAALEKILYKLSDSHKASRIDLLLSHGASLDHLPNGLPALLRYMFRAPDWDPPTVALLLQRGATLDSIPSGWARHLRKTFLRHGPGPQLDHIEHHFGVPFDRVDGGLHELLKELLSKPYVDVSHLHYLVQRGADPKNLPEIHSILENVVRHGIGNEVRICEFLLLHGAELKNTPSGLNQLLYDIFHAQVWRETLGTFLARQGADPERIWDGLHRSVLDFEEGAFTGPRLVWLARQTRRGHSQGDAHTL